MQVKDEKFEETEDYYRSLLSEPIDQNCILLEAGQGRHANGNMFAILKTIEKNSKYSNLIPYFTVRRENMDSIARMFAKYGFQKVRLVRINTARYKRVLAKAKYLITDNSFPTYFIKREEQIYINTWHGVPMKKIGRSRNEITPSIGNIQKNFLASDFIVSPNKFTLNVLKNDYMLGGLHKGKLLFSGYPRMDLLCADGNIFVRDIDQLNLAGKKIIAYMPTWREFINEEEKDAYLEQLNIYFKKIDDVLTDTEVLLVHMHFLFDKDIDFSRYHHVQSFPEDYEPYEVLWGCSSLITDYSSVLFDYAALGRKAIIFAPDLEEYLVKNGLYMQPEKLGIDYASSIDALIDIIKQDNKDNNSKKIDSDYLSLNNAAASEIILSIAENKQSKIEYLSEEEERENIFYFLGDISNRQKQRLFFDIIRDTDLNVTRPVLIFSNFIDKQLSGFLKKLPSEVSFMRLPPIVIDEIDIEKGLDIYKTSSFFTERMKSLYSYEYRRLLQHVVSGRFINLANQGSRIEGLFAYAEIKRLRDNKKNDIADKKTAYTDSFLTEGIDENTVLYSAYRHKIMSGNPYAIFKYLIDNPEYENYYHIWIYGRAQYLEYSVFIKYINHPRVKFVSQEDVGEYTKALAKSKYLICNAALPDFWQKKEGQIYINTWHGTPLKCLGYDARDFSESSIGNAQRNFLQCDYLVLQNKFAVDKILDGYGVRGLVQGKIIETGMPRTDLIFNADRKAIISILESLSGIDLLGKKVVLYAPTFRSGMGKGVDNSSKEIDYMIELAENMPEGYELFFKVHNMIQKYFSSDHIINNRLIFDEIETNELLSVTDVLITDYSSIFFDYACTHRPILFFAYDYDSYLTEHGLYMESYDLPGKMCFSVKDIVVALREIKDKGVNTFNYDNFISKYCSNDDGSVCQRIVGGIFGNDILPDSFTTTSLDHKDNYLYELGNGNDYLLINRLLSLLSERNYEKERALVSCNNISCLKPLVESFDGDIRIFCSSLEENISSREKKIVKNKGLLFSKTYFDRQLKKFYGNLKIKALFKMNYKDTFLNKALLTKTVLSSNDYINKPLCVLFLATYDSVNTVLEPVATELIKQGGVPIVISYDVDDNKSNMPFTLKQIKCLPVKKYKKNLLDVVDIAVVTPLNLKPFKEIMEDIKENDIPIISFATLYSSVVMRNYADFVFTIGNQKIKEFEKYHLKYNFILAGNPQYDILAKKRNNLKDEKEIKKVLIVDQGGYPYGAKGKRQLAATLTKITLFHKDKEFYIKPRYVEGDSSHQVHNVSEYLLDYFEERPENLHFIKNCKQLEEILPEYDAMITTWSTSFLAALVLNMPIIFVAGLYSEDVFDVRKQRIEEAYEDLKESGCVYDYKDLQFRKIDFKKANERFVKEKLYNLDGKSASKIVSAMYLIKTELKDKELRILPDKKGCDITKSQTVDEFITHIVEAEKVSKNDFNYFLRKKYLSELNTKVQEYVYISRCMGMANDISFIDKYYEYSPEMLEDIEDVRKQFKNYIPFESKRVNRWFDRTYKSIWEKIEEEWQESLNKLFDLMGTRKYYNDEILYGYYFEWLYNNGFREELINYSGRFVSSGARDYYCAKLRFDEGDIEGALNHLIAFVSSFLKRKGIVKTILERRLSESLGYFLKGNTEFKILFYKKLQENDLLDFLDYYKGYLSEKNEKVLFALFESVCKNTRAEEIYKLLKKRRIKQI